MFHLFVSRPVGPVSPFLNSPSRGSPSIKPSVGLEPQPYPVLTDYPVWDQLLGPLGKNKNKRTKAWATRSGARNRVKLLFLHTLLVVLLALFLKTAVIKSRGKVGRRQQSSGFGGFTYINSHVHTYAVHTQLHTAYIHIVLNNKPHCITVRYSASTSTTSDSRERQRLVTVCASGFLVLAS